MQKYGDWEVVRQLGEGGQSNVFLVRSPERSRERASSCQMIIGALRTNEPAQLAEACWAYARPDDPSELGALKQFKIGLADDGRSSPSQESADGEALERLKSEVKMLRKNAPGLPKLLDATEKERWIVTEYFPEGTLERHLTSFTGKVIPTLRAFRSLVSTVASLHDEGYVHRDIKPANVFFRGSDELVLGDFGIVYMPDIPERVTRTFERVGPRDYMPVWADFGDRLEDVQPNFDVYMLGKLLWCMVSGKSKLPREFHRESNFDLARIFPTDGHMHLVNSILDKCLVSEPSKCLVSARKLLEIVDESLDALSSGRPQRNRDGQLDLACHVCGKGIYLLQEESLSMRRPRGGEILLRAFVCNVCTNYQMFAPNFPDEAAGKNWKPWRDK
jgi:serine/threonine protein kinase